MKLEDIKPNTQIAGIEIGQVVRVVSVEPAGNQAITQGLRSVCYSHG